MSDPTQRLHETVFLSLPVSSSLFLSLNLSIPHFSLPLALALCSSPVPRPLFFSLWPMHISSRPPALGETPAAIYVRWRQTQRSIDRPNARKKARCSIFKLRVASRRTASVVGSRELHAIRKNYGPPYTQNVEKLHDSTRRVPVPTAMQDNY